MSKPSPAEKRVIEKLNRAEARRIKAYKDLRIVYAYRVRGCDAVCDNLLLLPYSEKDAHAIYLANLVKSLPEENHERFKDIDIVAIGTFNVSSLKFDSIPEKVLFSVYDVLKGGAK